MQYLVHATGGPGFAEPERTLAVLEEAVLPTFDHLIGLEAEGKIRAGGLPVADRAFIFVIEASSNDELDRLVRDIPAWGVLNWSVTPLQSVSERQAKEREVVEQLHAAAC
ncbi:MAG TPA: muconolactone Delta-isomerase family protein [Gaiellaceae bacterium]|nr:muconolactone Delta-isomerase family protein [Gaiellaceae bacterium]